MKEIKLDLTWKEKVIEVLEKFLREKISAPPATMKIDWSGRVWKKVQELSGQIKATKGLAQKIYDHSTILDLREINKTASQLVWERSAKSARESRKLSEDASNFTRTVVQSFSQKEKKEIAVSIVALQIKTMNSQKLTMAEAEKDRFPELSKLKAEIENFRGKAKAQLHDMSRSLKTHINQTVQGLHLAQRYISSSLEIQSLHPTIEEIVSNVKDETKNFAKKTSKIALKEIQKMFKILKDVYRNSKQTLIKTKLAYDRTMEAWTKVNYKAKAITRSILKLREIQSILVSTKQAIDQVEEDIKSAQQSNRMEGIKATLEEMSESAANVVKTASNLSDVHTTYSDFELDQATYSIWAQFYGSKAIQTALRVRKYLSFSKTNPFELRAKKDLDASVQKLNEALSYKEVLENISFEVAEDATCEMKRNVDLVQLRVGDKSNFSITIIFR